MPECRVLLVNPPVLEVIEPWFDAPKFGRVALAYLAAYLRQYDGFTIRIIDAKFNRFTFAQVVTQVVAWEPDIVGLTAFTNEIKPAAYQAALLKRALPGVITVIGGVHVTALPRQTLEEFESFDIGVSGEGEITFYELCAAIKDGKDFQQVPGLVFRKGGSPVVTAPRARIFDQTAVPLPAWDLLPRAEEYYIQSIRGCPLNCVFCMNHNGRVVRARSIQSVIGEMEMLIDEYRPKRISFGDELFSVDMERTHELLDAMIERKIGERVSWDVQTHVRYVDDGMFAKMKEAGITRVELGVETGNEDILKTLGKGTTIEMIQHAFAAARRAGVPTGSFFLFGQPNETVSSIKDTIAFATKINPTLPMFGVMVPYPGTEVSKLAAEGKGGYTLLSTDWDEYNKQIGGALQFANLSRSQIEQYQIMGYLKVFLYNLRFLDFLKFVREYRKVGLSVMKKIFRGKANIPSLRNHPPDYEKLIYKGRQGTRITLDELIASREEWRNTQRREMQATKSDRQDQIPPAPM